MEKQPRRIMVSLPSCNDDDAEIMRKALAQIAKNVPPEKLKKLGEVAADPKRLSRALNYLYLA